VDFAKLLLTVVLLFLTGIFVAVVMVWLVPSIAPPIVAVVAIVAAFAVGFLAMRFLQPGVHPLGLYRPVADELLVSQSYVALRVFQVEEVEDEGLHYYLELDDGTVLFLSGDYLYDDETPNFPCSRFTIRRHRDHGYVFDLQCDGEALQPEVVAPPFTADDHDHDRVPDDGTILTTPYDELKRERLSRA
jgi:hypothetical protein